MLEIQLTAIERDLRALARHQIGCRALMTQYGMGELSALVTLVELGDVTRMHASRQAVRMAGLDIGVHRSDRHAQLGKLTRQGSAPLRWALFEAAQSACRPTSPDYQDYHALKARGLVAHPRVADHRPQARAPLLPPPPSARPCRARAPQQPTHDPRSAQPTPSHDASPSCGQLPQRSRYPRHPAVAAHQRPSGRRRSTGTTDQPSRHRPPPRRAVAGPDKPGRPRSRSSRPSPADHP